MTDLPRERTRADSWPQWGRNLASVVLLIYLFLMVLAPLSNPVASADLTGPMAEAAGPALRALNLNHGYRFFGPEPGPSHLIAYTITDSAGKTKEYQIPDAQKTWPRLAYHRWFMLSESLFHEFDMTPTEQAFQEGQMQLAILTDELKREGKFSVAERVHRQRVREAENYERANKRIKKRVRGLAVYLLKQHHGVQIDLKIQERGLPSPLDLVREIGLDDPRYLTTLKTIGRYRMLDGELESLPNEQVVSDQGPLGQQGGMNPSAATGLDTAWPAPLKVQTLEELEIQGRDK